MKAHAIKAEAFLARWAPALLAVFALFYYAQYFRYGLNLGGEGGTNAVLAMRLMEGQRPIVDTFLGYNLLWFYPLIAIFKVTGPDYLAMRLFFFVLCATNALLGYSIVKSVTKQAWLAFSVGVLLVLIPGMIFRNYMGLIGVLSSLLLLKGYVLPAGTPRKQIMWMSAAGAGMAICFLLRIEPSLLVSLVWLGLAILYPFGSRTDFGIRLRTGALGTLAGILIFSAVHAGTAWHAYQRGFGPEFIGQYESFVGLLRYELQREIGKLSALIERAEPAAKTLPLPADKLQDTEPVAAPSTETMPGARAPFARTEDSPQVSPTSSTTAGHDDARESAETSPRDARLARTELSKVWQAERPRDRYFGLCLYYPVFWSIAFVATALVMLAVSTLGGDMLNKSRALIVLTTTGCSLSLFPQYFFFRPDAPHLSEFMVSFLPAIACSAWVIFQASREARSRIFRIPASFLAVGSLAIVPIYLKAIMPREDAGTVFRLDQPAEFHALNGVKVLLSTKDVHEMNGLRDAILNHSARGEYVLVYPYAPTVNFMTDRPSYEYNLYIDDSTADGRFQGEAWERIERYRPAVIVIDNRPINRTERSRFKNWAADLMSRISSNYRLVGTFKLGRREVEVYARPDKAENSAGHL